MEYCYCVSYNGYGDVAYFRIEKVFYGPDAKDKAIDLAIKLNINLFEEIYLEDGEEYTGILTSTEKSPEDNLKAYIRTLDYSNGNMKYEEPFYNCTVCQIEI